eukprot:CAMPEP_0182532098 /NCGR_PEP_ID=MMETSP1323-20130603/10863_1 /TAXON_ID=236787 /ORGANISM="Florenciella parvula, Strain RCC1693" /LENGTH=226 /DNA_ID=CAMNT_0024741779 /DNA_START=46 /DNA_END=726 /DNA_ORIENTATION=+
MRVSAAPLLLTLVAACLTSLPSVSASDAEGLAFLDENKGKEGVVTLESGMQYKVLRAGGGDSHPTANSPCDCHYAGTLIDGTTFDSSYDRGSPTSFAPNQVIKGWTEAMQLMVEGDKWELYIPSELAYGERGSPPKIPGGSVLVFTIEIITIKGDKVPASRCDVVTKEGCNEKEVAFIAKQSVKDAAGLQKEVDRLNGMKGGKMKPELAQWLTKRITLLSKMKDEL